MNTKRRIDRISKDARAIVEAIDRHSANTGKWLAAIALAASTPTDNSAQVQAEIDKLVTQLNAGTDEVKDAIDKQQKGA